MAKERDPSKICLRTVVQEEFFDSTFTANAERLRFVGGMLSRAALIQMQQAIERIATEFDELNRTGLRPPP